MMLYCYFSPTSIALTTGALILQQSADNSSRKKLLTFVNVLDRNVRGRRRLFYMEDVTMDSIYCRIATEVERKYT